MTLTMMRAAVPMVGLEIVDFTFVVRGIVASGAGSRLRPLDGWGWLLADAVASLDGGRARTLWRLQLRSP